MGTIATLTIRNKRNGKTRIINECEWAHDLGKGKYDGWERVGGETHGDADEAVRIDAIAAQAQRDADAEAAEAKRLADEAEAERVAAEETAEAARVAEEARLADEGSEAADETAGTDEPTGDSDLTTDELDDNEEGLL